MISYFFTYHVSISFLGSDFKRTFAKNAGGKFEIQRGIAPVTPAQAYYGH